MTKFDTRYDASLNTLFISADFAKKASNVNSREYRYLCEKRRENPTLIVKQRTRTASKHLKFKEMEAKLRQIDENGKLVEAFKLVMEIAKTESSPYAYVYNWFKRQMEAAKAEPKNEKKAAAATSKEDMKKQLEKLEGGISFKSSTPADAEEDMEQEEEFEEEEA